MTTSIRGDRRIRILVADTTPLSLLAEVPGALDWLFLPEAEVWLTDLVMEEAGRPPGEGKDQRFRHRAEISAWVERNRFRIKRQPTRAGRRYEREMDAYTRKMEAWERAGRPDGLRPDRPDWRDRADEGVWVAVRAASDIIGQEDCVVALADDRNVRDVISIEANRRQGASVDLMGTQTFIEWIHHDFGIGEAGTAWQAISAARRQRVPKRDDDDLDPVFVRTT